MAPRPPVALGVKVMLNVQLAPTASIDGQSFVRSEVLPLTWRAIHSAGTGCGVLPVLVTVTALGALVVLTI